jgi:hypothetical protein
VGGQILARIQDAEARLISGDSRYQDALADVEGARRDLEEYRDDLTLHGASWGRRCGPRD